MRSDYWAAAEVRRSQRRKEGRGDRSQLGRNSGEEINYASTLSLVFQGRVS